MPSKIHIVLDPALKLELEEAYEALGIELSVSHFIRHILRLGLLDLKSGNGKKHGESRSRRVAEPLKKPVEPAAEPQFWYCPQCAARIDMSADECGNCGYSPGQT
jgi:hypothetical protein